MGSNQTFAAMHSDDSNADKVAIQISTADVRFLPKTQMQPRQEEFH
jgi:hypothetical protein